MGELTKLPNIAAKLEAQLADAGITTAEELKEVGSREALLRILARDPSACIMRQTRRRLAKKSTPRLSIP